MQKNMRGSWRFLSPETKMNYDIETTSPLGIGN